MNKIFLLNRYAMYDIQANSFIHNHLKPHIIADEKRIGKYTKT